MSPNPSFTFVSHSTKDKPFVTDLAAQLQAAGLKLWVDAEDIADGAAWARAIQQGVENCGAMLVVWSAQARTSEWVEREILLAQRLNKPIFIAQIDDTPLPIFLINRQATDFRQRPQQATQRLIRALQKIAQMPPAAPSSAYSKTAVKPNEHNFFRYLEQLPQGVEAAQIARSLFAFAEQRANSITFSGKAEPAFHAHVWVGPGGLVIFSVRAYRRQPAVEVPLQYWMNFSPYDQQRERKAVLDALNRLMPEQEQFAANRANLRPNLPLVRALSEAQKLSAFEQVLGDAITRLNSGK
jgi:hypothetical protein